MYSCVQKTRIKPYHFVLRMKMHDIASSYWKDENINVYYN